MVAKRNIVFPPELTSAFKQLADKIEMEQFDALQFINSGRIFRSVLDEYLLNEKMDEASREDIIKIVERLFSENPVEVSKEGISIITPVLTGMVDFSRNPKLFSGEENELSYMFNTTLSTLDMVIQMSTQRLMDKMKMDKASQMNFRKTLANIPPDQKAAVEFYKQYNPEFYQDTLKKIDNMVSNDSFWNKKSKTGITGISQIKSLLQKNTIEFLSKSDAEKLFNDVVAIAQKRIGFREPHSRFESLIFSIYNFFAPRHSDTQKFYEALIDASNCSTENLDELESKISNDAAHADIKSKRYS